jgi:hypothetical protein
MSFREYLESPMNEARAKFAYVNVQSNSMINSAIRSMLQMGLNALKVEISKSISHLKLMTWMEDNGYDEKEIDNVIDKAVTEGILRTN